MNTEMADVRSLYVQCVYTEKAGAYAMSDCCRKPATTAVEDPYGGLYYYRCAEHEGMFRDGIPGAVHQSVPRAVAGGSIEP